MIHRGNRFITVYDLESLAEVPPLQEWPVLPDSWIASVSAATSPRRSRSTSRVRTPPPESSPTRDLPGVLSEIADAPEGDRNNTLNEHAFRLAIAAGGTLEAEIEDEMTEAAMESGLDEEEILNTLESAQDAAMERHSQVDRWMAEVHADPTINRKRSRNRVTDLARILAQHALIARVSLRQLSEELGASHQAVHRYLKLLEQRGLVRLLASPPGTPSRYRLVFPYGKKCDNPPLSPPHSPVAVRVGQPA